MKFKEAILEILKERGLRKVDLANSIGISKACLGNQLTRNKTWIDATMIKWLSGCGYKLVIIPKETPLPKDSIELE